MTYEIVAGTTPTLTITLTDADGALNLSGNIGVFFRGALSVDAAALAWDLSCNVSSPATDGIVTVTMDTTDTATAGIYYAEIKVTYTGIVLKTKQPLIIKITKGLSGT